MTLVDEILVLTNIITLVGWLLAEGKLEKQYIKMYKLSKEFRRLKKRLNR